MAAKTELIIALLSITNPHESPCHCTFLHCFWLLSCLDGNFFRLISTNRSTAVRALPVVWMYQRFCRFLPINISQTHLSLPVLLLNSYLGSHRLMSQLLQHPFPDHWQTHSCPDGVLIHNAAAEITPHPGFLFTHFPGSFSFLYQATGLHFQGLFHLIAHFIQHPKVNSHTWTVHSSCFYSSLANFVVSLETLCHICEKVSVKPCFVAPLNLSPEIPSDQKKSCQRTFLSWALVVISDVLLLRLIWQERTCYNIRNLEKHHEVSSQSNQNRLRYVDLQHLISKQSSFRWLQTFLCLFVQHLPASFPCLWLRSHSYAAENLQQLSDELLYKKLIQELISHEWMKDNVIDEKWAGHRKKGIMFNW